MGAYTHDEAFKIPMNFAYSLLLKYYETEAYQERADQAREELRRNTNK